ncbi:hypothetical protein [Burkholderia vietnamiensis]|uniref:hypothetical protein n=1 Tax=Burkholderia vietnamiensis TaxID=60552 RepID=UPI000AD29B16|nr:hypothetical protein [Burkholderia vietnamiensis]
MSRHRERYLLPAILVVAWYGCTPVAGAAGIVPDGGAATSVSSGAAGRQTVNIAPAIGGVSTKGIWKMKRIHFFATKNDVLLITDFIESKGDVKYILSHHHFFQEYGAEAPIFNSARNIPDLGVAAKSQTGSCKDYILVGRSVAVEPMSRFIGENLPEGGKWYTAYESGNCNEGVAFNAGGFWSDGTLINGLIQTWSDDSAAQKIMRQAASAFKKYYPAKINVFWIGPEAYELLKSGRRLTQNVAASPEFDLKIPNA